MKQPKICTHFRLYGNEYNYTNFFLKTSIAKIGSIKIHLRTEKHMKTLFLLFYKSFCYFMFLYLLLVPDNTNVNM